MRTRKLGQTDIEVTDWCLGTMTYGGQTPEADAHAQLDMAREAGLNFLDCAEMYPTNPVTPETVGLSEEFLGNWFAKTGRRDEWVVATKVSGPNAGMVRDGRGYDGEIIRRTVDESLKRLQTDRIDLYQLHWPERGSYHFRRNWTFDPSGWDKEKIESEMLDVLVAMDEVIRSGKVRAFGLSNETAWGTAAWLRLAQANRLPRVATVQNEHSLMARLFDTDMTELSVLEEVTLMSFSPLAGGLLTGKYQGGVVPEGSRMSRTPDLAGRKTDRAFEAVAAYHKVAEKHGLDPIHMALAWQRSRPTAPVAIIGATSQGQLERILEGRDLELAPEVIEDLDAVHKAIPLPY